MRYRRKAPREKDLTGRYFSGNYDEDRVDSSEAFTARSKNAELDKIMRTTAMRASDKAAEGVETLPQGQVVQVYSLFSDVEFDGNTYLCVTRKTLTRTNESGIVVGDRVRFRPALTPEDLPAEVIAIVKDVPIDKPKGVIEQVLPRDTVLTRADSFKGIVQHPIVANAAQMLIVVSLKLPAVKWGLVDRIIVAAQSGKLRPIVCLNKIDLADPSPDAAEAETVLAHYAAMGILTLRTSVTAGVGLERLRELLKGQETVLAGHSGVGKSSLLRALQPQLDIRVGEISAYTAKGRHTTTSARRYVLDFGGAVIDTPGVKHFGLWGVTRDTLSSFFPDIEAGTAPPWRKASYQRIAASVAQD